MAGRPLQEAKMLEIDGPAPFRLATCHFERAVDFWHAALGLTVRPRGFNRADLVDADDCVRLLIRRAPPPHRQHPRIVVSACDVADVQAATRRFIELGGSYPQARHLSRPDCAVVYDPDGNTVEIRACRPHERGSH